MKLVLVAALATAAVALAACNPSGYRPPPTYASTFTRPAMDPTPAQAEKLAAIHKAKPPRDYKKKVDQRMVAILKDPASRKVEFTSNPYGSLVCGLVNAKNSYGGYTGNQPWFATFDAAGKITDLQMFSDSDIKNVLRMRDPGDYRFVEYSILKACGAL